MIPTTVNYWPFDVLPPEKRTEQHWQEIRFLDTALQEGFKPFEQAAGEYKATSPQGREACILFRGRGRRNGPGQWEVWLDEPDLQLVKLWVDDFEYASGLILDWLRGKDITAALSASGKHIMKGPQITKAKGPTASGGVSTSDITNEMPPKVTGRVPEPELAALNQNRTVEPSSRQG